MSTFVRNWENTFNIAPTESRDQAFLDPECFCIYTDLNAQKLFVGWIRIGYGYGMEISERTSAMSTIMITMSNTQRHTGWFFTGVEDGKIPTKKVKAKVGHREIMKF